MYRYNPNAIWPIYYGDWKDVLVLNSLFDSAMCGNKKSENFLFNIDFKDERFSDEAVNWRMAVFERDNYKCVCGNRGDIQAHHIKGWTEFPELRYKLDNGVTLCRKCHSNKHPKHANFILKSRYHNGN